MRTFEVIAVLQKSFDRAMTQQELDQIVMKARRGQKLAMLNAQDAVKIFRGHREAYGVNSLLAIVRAEIGEDPEIISIEMIPDENLAENQV